MIAIVSVVECFSNHTHTVPYIFIWTINLVLYSTNLDFRLNVVCESASFV